MLITIGVFVILTFVFVVLGISSINGHVSDCKKILTQIQINTTMPLVTDVKSYPRNPNG